ncbi:MAG: hypothetical protein J6J09_03185 [Phocaeicola sp.]|nr:hypothetical protein [Phocaeicola sp.]
MMKYTVISGMGNVIYNGNEEEEAIYQRDEFEYEYPEIGASLQQNF